MQHSANGQTARLEISNDDVKVWQEYQTIVFVIEQAIRALDENAGGVDEATANGRRLVLLEMRVQARTEALAELTAVQWS